MKKATFAFSLIILLTSCSTQENDKAQRLTYGTPQSVGLADNRLENIDRVLQQGVDSSYVKGIAGMIVRDGTIAYHKAFGSANEENQPLEKDAIFRIASQTKAITSVAAMMLFEEGKFLLDDPIENYLPEFKDMTVVASFNDADSSYTSVPADKKITVRHLLTHTSGMSYFGFGNRTLRSIYAKNGMPSIFGSDDFLLSDFSKIAGAQPLHHEPGERFTYGINTDILGRFIEVTSGLSLAEFFHTRIFQPLGMNDTYFYVPQEKWNRLVPVFALEEGVLQEFHGLDEYGVALDYPLTEGTFYGGGAGLSSTLMDYAIFLQMLLNGGEYGGQRLLSRTTVSLMTHNQIGDLMLGQDKFGLGFRVKTMAGQQEQGESQGSFSWGGYYGTTYWADPEENIIGLVFTNQRKQVSGNLRDKFRVMTYAALDD
ncbi:MAG: serine hydrolase domain-containing protein [Cyclobacteriaceae bacterium]